MKISNELRDRILDEVRRREPEMEAVVAGKTFESEFVLFPIYLGGVFDMARYNVQEERFDQIMIRVATEGIMTSDMLPDWTAWCDKSEEVIIPLEGK